MRSLSKQSNASQELKRKDSVKPLAQDLNEVQLIVSDTDLKLIVELRDLLAHKLPNVSMGEIVSAALVEAKKAMQDQKSGKIRRAARSEPTW